MTQRKIQWEKLSPLFIILIVIFSFFLRIPSFFDGSFAYTYDVGRDLIVLSEITETLKPPLIGPTSGLHGLFYGPWWYYITLVPFALSSGDPRGVLLFMILTGVATVWIGYIVGRKIDGLFLGLLFSALLAVSPVLTGISKQIWNPNIAPLFLSVILFLLVSFYKIADRKVKGVLSRRNLFVFSLGFFLTLSIDAEIVYGSILFISTIIFIIVRLRKQIRLADIFVFLLGVICILLPRIVFEMRHEFLMTQALLAFLSGSSGDSFSISLLGNLENRLVILFDLWKRTVAFNNEIVGLFLIIGVISNFLFFRKKNTKTEDIFYGFCFFVIGGYYLILCLFQQDIWDHYIVGLPVVYVLLLSLTLNSLRKHWAKKRILVIAIALIFCNTYDVVSHFPSSKDVGDSSFYRNHLKVVDFIYENAKGEPFNTITYTPPVHDYTYRYLFKWYGQRKYGYRPSISNEEAFYVIVEPDYELPERRGQWIRDRSVDGVNLGEKNFDGDIIVQVRKH